MTFPIRKILNWYKQHGRQTLPWQQQHSAYHTWISEIMLQQTQVQTVIPYFHRFIKRFPSIFDLASASLDEVLYLWTGLGYYARARHLHSTAKKLAETYSYLFPKSLDQIQTLPGIGRSTAGAILSLGMNIRATILDGNIKRVLLRYHAIQTDPKKSDTLKHLWKLAENHTPKQQFAVYNQAMMDMGALICKRSEPYCQKCPLNQTCQAHLKKITHQIPAIAKKKKSKPIRSTRWLILKDPHGNLLFEKRYAIGIWGKLWSFPECPLDTDWQALCKTRYGCLSDTYQTLPSFRHTFSHFHLDITPILITIQRQTHRIFENSDFLWHNPNKPFKKGLPQPIKRLLEQLKNDPHRQLC
jgi:A/G-specific adenine glycosylase